MNDWPHWGSFWLGVVCAYVVPWVLLVLVVGGGVMLAKVRRRRRMAGRSRAALEEAVEDALTTPGVAAVDVLIALQRRQEERDVQAVEDLLRSLKGAS